MIESVNKGRDGVIRLANIHTTTGRTNRPITRLYPLELTAEERSTDVQDDIQPEQSRTDVPTRRPVREAARRGQQLMRQWTTSLCAPPEDVPEI